MRLSELDQLFDETPGFRIVDSLKLDESGVDPVGLRQLNLDLMDATVPGINNVTQHIRPYTFMAWAWWRASRYAASYGLRPDAVLDLVERYEAIYAWSHSIAGRPFRGNVTVTKWLKGQNGTDAFTFSGADWEDYKREKTGFMAPTEYGPSIKALRFLKPEGGLFGWASEAMPATLAIDAIVSRVLPERVLLPNPPSVEPREIEPMALALPIDEPTDEEQAVFRLLFYEIGALDRAGRNMRRRKGTIDLIRCILVNRGPLDIDDLRRSLATCINPVPGDEGSEVDMRNSSIMLCHLQARQLQRLATETMMLWTEVFLAEKKGRSRPMEDIVAAAHEAAAENDPPYARSAVVGDYLRMVEQIGADAGWPVAGDRPETDVVGLLSRLRQAQRKDLTLIPSLVIRSLAVVRAVTKAFADSPLPDGVFNSIEARPDRMPMGIMVRKMDALEDRPLLSLWKEIIESWIIGQHVHWSAVRGGDGKKRLRIGLDGDGWMLVRPAPSGGFAPTPDRLWTLLSLGSACALFKRTKDGRYAAA